MLTRKNRPPIQEWISLRKGFRLRRRNRKNWKGRASFYNYLSTPSTGLIVKVQNALSVKKTSMLIAG